MAGGRPKKRGRPALPEHLLPIVSEFPPTNSKPIEKLSQRQKKALQPKEAVVKKGRESGVSVTLNRGVDYVLNNRG